MEIETIAKKWGSSIGIILPKIIIEKNKIRENDKIIVEIKKKVLAGELFGKFPEWTSKKSAQELKDEARAGWGK
jgi:antitoxin component of MazEF toxin-antitoxin module